MANDVTDPRFPEPAVLPGAGQPVGTPSAAIPESPPCGFSVGDGAMGAPPPIPNRHGNNAAESVRSRRLAAGVVVLTLAAVSFGAASWLEVDRQGEKVLVGPQRWPLPQLCYWRNLLGWRCPGCGLTRSVVTFLHGDYARAFRFHPLGPFVLLTAWGWASFTFVRRSGQVLGRLWFKIVRCRPKRSVG